MRPKTPLPNQKENILPLGIRLEACLRDSHMNHNTIKKSFHTSYRHIINGITLQSLSVECLEIWSTKMVWSTSVVLIILVMIMCKALHYFSYTLLSSTSEYGITENVRNNCRSDIVSICSKNTVAETVIFKMSTATSSFFVNFFIIITIIYNVKHKMEFSSLFSHNNSIIINYFSFFKLNICCSFII